MVKENRSDWVAVAPEHSAKDDDDLPKVTPAQTAYQYFQRKNSQQIKESLISRGEMHDLPNLTKAISKAWQSLSAEDKKEYEDVARDDQFRFMRESHLRDMAVLKRKEQLRKERDEIIVTEGNGPSTRRARKKEMKKAAKAEKRAGKKNRIKQIEDSDEEEFKSDDDDGSSSSSNSSEFDENESDSSSSSSSSGSIRGSHKQSKKKRKAPVVSEAVLARRDKAKKERAIKEKYIAERQEDLREERAAQAKKRLDFLLKQSDIFRHFGEVKEDKGKFYGNRVNTSSSVKDLESPSKAGTNRREASSTKDIEAEELGEADEQQRTYLTSQPDTLGYGKMRPYQLEGLNWMIRLQENGVNGILADEMGLGKTLQSISILVYMMEYANVNGPHLVVVPKSTLSNWMAEFDRWAPTLKAIKFHGTKIERETIAKDILQPGQRDENRSWNVVVTTYEVCNMDKQVLNKFAWSYLIIDEAHRLKNEASAFSKTIRTFETRYRLLLTGTPLQNNLHELWALLNFLVPDVFASAEQFDEWFNLDIEDADEKNKLISQLHKILRPFMLRRLKVDVETSLPPKHETILFTGMSAMQKKLYKDILLRDIDVLQGGNGGGSHTAILNIVMQLRKCAGHPYLFPGIEDRSLPPLGEHLVENCGKMVLLDKLLIRLKEKGHRVLLFTQMTRILDILEDYLVMRQFQYCRIDGNTDYEQREERINAFNAPGSEKFIFLLSTRAGGLGINLQTADVVILYDSDWNPQADLQAQDRAHRIGQKKPVQIFRLVTENTIEEKIVERAQQKLKLDAMVVQQGRLKEKDKLSRDELLAAVRFGADKVFKTKDSSITDDDIDLILEAGEKKTQELNDKLKAADKGDMLDFKLDGGMNVQTFEGVDYSKTDFAQAKAAQEQAEILSILDMGKRERRTVANYNEDQLYRQQIASNQGPRKVQKKKKEIKLPRHMRLPRLDEWQMFDRETLNAIQEEEEKAFRQLPEEMQMVLKGKQLTNIPVNKESEDGVDNDPLTKPESETDNAVDSQSKKSLSPSDIPPLISKERQDEKERLLTEGFSDWGRSHYTAFIRASAKYGRHMYSKIAAEVGKTQAMVEAYAAAFWDENFGKKRFSENEYDRGVKRIEQGEKKLHTIKVLETATERFVSLFDNPWQELEFTYVNVKDKIFTVDEDRHLLCWSHKYGYGQWDAIKMAIRRSPEFRFDYYLRSLPVDAIGRRCEQLMKAAEKEIEHMIRKAKEDAAVVEEEKKENNMNCDTDVGILAEVELPSFMQMKEERRRQVKEEIEAERKNLEGKVEEIESQIEEIQNRLKQLQKYSNEISGGDKKVNHNDFPDDLLPELANLVARSGSTGIMSIANEFVAEHGQTVTKKIICSKIEDIAKKERHKEEGDLRAVWHVLPEYMNLLTVETIRYLRKEKESRLEKKRGGIDKKKRIKSEQMEDEDRANMKGAVGPDGDFVEFPDYDGVDEPRECKKAFTLFCTANRRDVKKSLDPVSRKDRDKVNQTLKQQWLDMSDDDREIWAKWQVWDRLRYERDLAIRAKHQESQVHEIPEQDMQAKRKGSTDDNVPDSTFHIPKKKRCSA